MTIGRAQNMRFPDSDEFEGTVAKKVIPGLSLSANEIASSASIGDTLGTVSITSAYVGTPSYSLLNDGSGQFTINSSTGAVRVAHVLTEGSTSIRVKVQGTTPH